MVLVYSCKPDLPEEVEFAAEKLPDQLDFNLHVKPILSDNCFFCHGPDQNKLKAGLRLDQENIATQPLSESGLTAINPGNLNKSELVHRILADDQDYQMPPPESNLSLSATEKAILIKWIEQGAEYQPHWAFQLPAKYDPPPVSNEQVVNDIDRFIFKKLVEKQLKPKSEADRETLIRRLSFDLTGLPPTIEEIDAFLYDHSEDAYEKIVDRLLQSPHYGERMAVDWMDLARFADTHGYTVDKYRPMWPWRDWVIEAFNQNMPYDQFVTLQLAGDLIPNPSREQKLATAFNRNHAQNREGGIINEEYRVEYVADRTNTLGKAFLAITLECARCHDHKYDPVSQKNYYQLFSFFNNIDEAGQISFDDAMPVPTMLLTDTRQDSIISYLKHNIEQQEKTVAQIEADEIKAVVDQNLQLPVSKYLRDGLLAHFDFENVVGGEFMNLVNPAEKAHMVEPQMWKSEVLDPQLVKSELGQSLLLNGDDPLTLKKIGIFDRAQPFSVALMVKFSDQFESGVIFHKGQGAILNNFRGYHLAVRGNHLEAFMAHTWPYNNMVSLSSEEIPRNQWLHLTFTYDGSSRASGMKVYLDGNKIPMKIEKDNLYKDILFSGERQPGLKFGARWRGQGIKNSHIDEIMIYDRELTEAEVLELSRNTQVIKPVEIAKMYMVHNSNRFSEAVEQLEKIRRKHNRFVEEIPEIMVMDEMEQSRPAFILKRGAYDAYGEEVSPDTPESIMTFPDSLPRNRLGLARWLFSSENPLTARVYVNRVWQSFFGQGLVKSSDDFGNQGDLPTHPELLDWLANWFMDSGWDIKALQKLIVMSATYRQGSQLTEEAKTLDYGNSYLSRGPSSRLTAEMLRDNALAASGLLVRKIGGKSVKPYQPDDLWRVNGGEYITDTGDNLYRRSLYTFWKRTVPPPSMNTYDAPTRSYCVVKRQKTSTPLQSLILLNDPQFIEASRALAARAMFEKDRLEARVKLIFRLLTAKKPDQQELLVLVKFCEKQISDFKSNPEKAEGWLQTGEFRLNDTIEKDTAAGLAVTASMIMNADVTLTKR